jgi:hypothetical protein
MRIFKIWVLVLFCLLMAAIPSLAADETLLGNSTDSTSIWGIDLKSTPVNGQSGLFLGGYNGRVMNDGTLIIGSEGYILLTPLSAPSGAPNIGVDCNIGLYYCGLTCEYIMRPSKLIQVSGSVLAGLCYVKYIGAGYNMENGLSALCCVVEPGVNVMMNVSDSLKAGLGVSYRWVTGLNMQGLTNDDLKGVSINFIFRFVEF